MIKTKSNSKSPIAKSEDFTKQFPLIKNSKISYLDSAATTQKPQIVIDALKNFYETSNANVHRGIYKLSENATQKLENARKTIARFINADHEEIIFVKNATDGFNSIANSIERTFEIDNTHNIVTTIIEHHSNFVTFQQLARRKGAEFRIVDYDVKTNSLLDIEKSVDENTLVVSFTGMSNVTGLIVDVKTVIKNIRKKNPNVLIILDASQLVVHKRIDVKDLDVDFLVFSAHKIYGPTGVGIVYGKRVVLEKIHPFNYGGNMINRVEKYDSDWAELPEKFEAGTIDTPGIVATSVAIEYFEKNFNEIMKNEEHVQKYLLSELKKISKVKIMGHNTDSYGPVVSFNIQDIHPHDVSSICDKHDVCIRAGHHCAQPFMQRLKIGATSRVSLGMYNTKEDVDRLIVALKDAIKIIG